MNLLRQLRRLLRNTSGVSAVEFALGAPFLLTAGLWGSETANYALVNMRVGQLAVHIADNASRIGDTSSLQNRKIYESDINDVIYGAQVQGGPSIGLYDNGRVIISSLEVRESAASGDDEQYIHWQRCRGAKVAASSFGGEDDALADGMGREGSEVIAQPGDAVIFVEINYTYQPLISSLFMGSLDIISTASFTVRDDRDLSQIYQRNPTSPDSEQQCIVFTGNVGVANDGTIS